MTIRWTTIRSQYTKTWLSTSEETDNGTVDACIYWDAVPNQSLFIPVLSISVRYHSIRYESDTLSRLLQQAISYDSFDTCNHELAMRWFRPVEESYPIRMVRNLGAPREHTSTSSLRRYARSTDDDYIAKASGQLLERHKRLLKNGCSYDQYDGYAFPRDVDPYELIAKVARGDD